MTQDTNKDPENAGVTRSNLPFCDFRCPNAGFPKDKDIDGSKSCRTFAAVWCDELQEYVTKNAPCPLKFGKRRPKANW